MNRRLKNLFQKNIPQNFIIRRPGYGALVIAAFTVAFALIYQPLGAHAGRFLGYELTMVAYALLSAITLYGWIHLLVKVKYFSARSRWTLLKELTAIFILLFGMGVTIYFAAFIIEVPANRWNLSTFLDSVISAFLIGIIPFLFFTSLNVFSPAPSYTTVNLRPDGDNSSPREELVQITSQVKKESLSFYPSRFIYAESESNYVNFYLLNDDKIQKKIIRNSISDIEQQLAHIPFLLRTHRAFIVNLKHIRSKKGNSLGYRLKLLGIDIEIPVSRNKTHEFSKRLKLFS
jgi:hypothetical protein